MRSRSRATISNDSERFSPTSKTAAPKGADLDSELGSEETGAVFRLEEPETSDNVDSLLDEIRNELEKLDS